MFKKLIGGVSLGLFALPTFAFMPTDDFQVVRTQFINNTNSVQSLADVAGAVQVGKDYRPTTDTNSPLYKFKTLTYFLKNGKKMSGHVANISIINCTDQTFLQGITWHYVDDNAPPIIIPPKNDFEPMNDMHAFYGVAKELCHFK
ncbi:hypothetical protein [Moraxella oblonga]|uniref:hypothetical protein n=1 Tax=Moraxella oblonga TaxID=200413 RepID=UPI000A4BF0B8|nr:hypothetical protein [Moraxella oblonga]